MRVMVNSDRELAQMAREALKANDGYCPCALERNEDTKCMCKDFKEKMANGYKGECNCGLYEAI